MLARAQTSDIEHLEDVALLHHLFAVLLEDTCADVVRPFLPMRHGHTGMRIALSWMCASIAARSNEGCLTRQQTRSLSGTGGCHCNRLATWAWPRVQTDLCGLLCSEASSANPVPQARYACPPPHASICRTLEISHRSTAELSAGAPAPACSRQAPSTFNLPIF
jgi:hypothetical protein